MVGVSNPIGIGYSITLSNNAIERSKLMKAAVTGQKQDISVVNYILGTKAQYAANSYKTILKKIGNGVNLTNTAIEVLSNIQKQIEEMKTSLIALNNTNQDALQPAEKNYQNQWDQIFSTLKNSEFAGKKLFDGTFAKAPEVRVAAHNLPEHAHPFEIPLGSSDPSYKVSIPIPRLLPSDGTINIPTADGTYTPICQTSSNIGEALEAVRNIPVTMLNRLSTAVETGDPVWRYAWNEIDETGSFGSQLQIIRNALPEGVNAALDLAHRFCVDNFRRLCRTRYQQKPFVETQWQAEVRLICVKSAAGLVFIPNIRNVLSQAIDEIVPRINAIDDVVTVNQMQQELVNIRDHQAVDNLSRMLSRVAFDSFRTSRNIFGGVPAIKPVIIQYLRGVNNFINNNGYAEEANSILIGSVLTFESRSKAGQILDYASDTLTKVIANLKGKQNDLAATKINLETLTVNLSEASSNYLNTDYEKIVLKLIELLRKDRLASLAFGLSENTVNAVVSQMESIANHS